MIPKPIQTKNWRYCKCGIKVVLQWPDNKERHWMDSIYKSCDSLQIHQIWEGLDKEVWKLNWFLSDTSKGFFRQRQPMCSATSIPRWIYKPFSVALWLWWCWSVMCLFFVLVPIWKILSGWTVQETGKASRAEGTEDWPNVSISFNLKENIRTDPM